MGMLFQVKLWGDTASLPSTHSVLSWEHFLPLLFFSEDALLGQGNSAVLILKKTQEIREVAKLQVCSKVHLSNSDEQNSPEE